MRFDKFLTAILAFVIATTLSSCSSHPRHYKYKKSKKFSSSSAKRIKNFAKKSANETSEESDYESAENDNEEKYTYPEKEYAGYYKIGNSYEILGASYTPQVYEDYEEVGTASWYGDDFHGKKTANGETYNMRDMTAAHPTLPLPSLVRVTNLRNGKKIIARVNDRGPFAKERIIDVSERAAEALGFKSQGTTEVKIEFLKDDTDDLLKKLKIK